MGIISNPNQTQLGFTWQVAENSFIEVLSTMAPCIPIMAFRTNHIKFM
jgi:hypothetical protein